MRASLLVALALVCCNGQEAGGDAGTDAGADDGDAATCVYGDTRTAADRMCSLPGDCVAAPRSVSCCQLQYVGIRKDRAEAYVNQQKSMVAACLGCGCMNAMPIDDEGNSGGAIVASCDQGVCTSHAQ